MMIERHYDDEALVTMLATGAGTADAHLTACGECTEKLDTFRLVTTALHDAATWDKREINEAPNPNTIATLRAFADSMSAEDTAAEAFLASLLAGPRESWMATLTAHPEYRTPGTVRRLIAATDRALDTMPADAVEITALAVEIAEKLDGCRADTLARLRGGAWRERAYALFYTGKFAEAEKAVDVAQRHFGACVVDEYEQARVGIVGSLVERAMEHYDAGALQAARSAGTFNSFGDARRTVSAQLAEVNSRFSRGEFTLALRVLTALEASVRNTDDANTHAIVLGNLGYCVWKLGKVSDALRYQEAAASLFDEIGNHAAAVRARWNTASILASEGQVAEAAKRFQFVQSEFTRFGMTGSATLASLDRAEMLLVSGEHFSEVEEICRNAMQTFATAGVPHSEGALTALGLMREAASRRAATPALVRHVREYIRRLPDEPRLLFAPPPG